jgi:hypothetical protein
LPESLTLLRYFDAMTFLRGVAEIREGFGQQAGH